MESAAEPAKRAEPCSEGEARGDGAPADRGLGAKPAAATRPGAPVCRPEAAAAPGPTAPTCGCADASELMLKPIARSAQPVALESASRPTKPASGSTCRWERSLACDCTNECIFALTASVAASRVPSVRTTYERGAKLLTGEACRALLLLPAPAQHQDDRSRPGDDQHGRRASDRHR